MVNSPKLRGTYDLLAIVVLTALLIICIVFIPSDVPRIIIGLPFVLFFPGYTLMAALFPRKESLSGIERAVVSFGLSMAVVPLIGLLLNYVWEISVYPMLVSIAAFVAVMCVLAWLQRRRLRPQERYQPQISLPVPRWAGQSPLDRALSIVLVLAILAIVGTSTYIVVSLRSGEEFTEFYVLGPFGIAADYPRDMTLGENANLTLGIIDHEGEDVTYRVQISIDGAESEVREGISLRDGEKWEDTVTLTPTKAGDRQEVEFLLYRDGESEPYRELHLWINVLG